jgi:hypothetical protein
MNLSGIKTGCVIQGNFRNGCDEVIRMMSKHFTYVVFSTWEYPISLGVVVPQNLHILINEKPEAAGLSNRNLQRVSSINGIRLLKTLGCSYIMKWRSDMLPTNIDISALILKSSSGVPPLGFGKLLTTTTRIRSVSPDWFSSISDFYHFGPTDLMELLWDDKGMDLSRDFNPPPGMLRDLGTSWIQSMDPAGAYFCAEQELYAWFKYRLLEIGYKSEHRKVIQELFLPLDTLNICWFGSKVKMSPLSFYFRPTRPGMFYQWWKPSYWTRKRSTPIFERTSIDINSFKTSFIGGLLLIPLLLQIFQQYYYYLCYKLKNA